MADLDARLVRTIGDPETRFPEDPVRILRAIKFAARLGFDIEPATYTALLNHEHEIHQCAAPRVLEEIYRLLRGGAARRSMELLLETGVATTLAPELVAMFQGPPWLEGAAEGSGEDPLLASRPRAWRVLDELDGLAARTAPPLTRRREGRVYVEPGKSQPPPPSAPPTPEVALAELSGRSDLDDLERSALAVAAAVPAEEPSAPPVDAETPTERIEPVEAAPAAVTMPTPSAPIMTGPGEETFWTSPPTNALLLTALVAPFVPEVHSDRPGELFSAVDDALNPLATRMRVSRRDFERARQILLLQKRLAPSRRRRGRPMQLTRREYFGEALALYELLSRAAGDLSDEVSRWRQLWRRSSAAVGAGSGLPSDDDDFEHAPHARPLPEGGEAVAMADGGLPAAFAGDPDGKRRRRRRRGGRRRQKGGGAAGGGEIDALVAAGASSESGGKDEA
jgi:poly(A) polymerase